MCLVMSFGVEEEYCAFQEHNALRDLFGLKFICWQYYPIDLFFLK